MTGLPFFLSLKFDDDYVRRGGQFASGLRSVEMIELPVLPREK